MTATMTNAAPARPGVPSVPPPRQRRRRPDDEGLWVLSHIGRAVGARIESDGLTVDQLGWLGEVLGVSPSTFLPSDPDNARAEVAASVTAAMVAHGYTPDTLAALVGVPVPRLWRRLQGLASFRAEDVVRIARALDVEVGVLLG